MTIPINNLVPGVGANQVLQNAGAPVAGTSEVQTITITGTPTGGTFTLSAINLKGQVATTTPLAYSASAATVVAALVAALGAGAVTGSGGALPGTPVVVTFAAAYAKRNIPQMTADGSLLTGGSSPTVAVTTTTPGVPPTLGGRLPAGGLIVDTTNKTLSQNTGTTAAPVFTSR